MRFSSWLFGIASALAGLFDLIWGEFELAHQPIQAWGDHIPGLPILSFVVLTPRMFAAPHAHIALGLKCLQPHRRSRRLDPIRMA